MIKILIFLLRHTIFSQKPANRQRLKSMKVRNIEYRLYPNKKQEQRLLEIIESHRQLYNAALQQRIEAWRRQKETLSFYDQGYELKTLREENPEYEALDFSSLERTLNRLDGAYKAFFRRVKNGEKAGFPRFKGKERFDSFTLRCSGWKLLGKKLRLSDVGVIKHRGSGQHIGKLKTCTIKYKAGKWYAFITVETEVSRAHGTQTTAFDWGLTTYLTVGNEFGEITEVKNPRYLKQTQEKLGNAQRVLSRKKRGSKRRAKAKHRVQKLHEKVANQRKDFQHKLSAELVKNSAVIITEQLNVKKMSTSESSAHNRSVLDAAPGTLLQMIRYKAEEASIEFVELDTKVVKPTQTCSGCGHQEKKTLAERTHDCKECGLLLPRDVNSVQVMLNTFYGAGNQPARKDLGLKNLKHCAEPC